MVTHNGKKKAHKKSFDFYTAEDDPNGSPEEGATESSEQPQNNDEDVDVANMVLDEEMEQAALKIQSTFRGHKIRKDIKKEAEVATFVPDEPQVNKDAVQEVDDEIANMVLDEEMEQAALKIQCRFRGEKIRKDMKKKDESGDENNEKNNEDEPIKEENKEESIKEEDKDEPIKEDNEDESIKEEEASQPSLDAKQLQDEEDIANLVMDAEMEQTALKIQSAFRGKTRKKATKDGEDSCASSAGDQIEEDNIDESEKVTFYQNEMSQEQMNSGEDSYDEKGFENSAKPYSLSNEIRFSTECQNTSGDYDPLASKTSTDDLNLMQGGGIFFPETSGESSDMLTCSSSGDGEDPEPYPSNEKIPSNDIENPISQRKCLDDEEIIKNFDFVANRDTAEAMYYSLKKNELKIQKELSGEKQLATELLTKEQQIFSMETITNFDNPPIEKEEDVDDLVSAEEIQAKRFKFGMSMDDRLLGSILSQEYATKTRREGYPDDGFDPLLEATMRYHFLENLHNFSNSDEDKNLSYSDYPGDDEDQFEDFYNSNIRQKIMASSFSIADSDFFDPTNNKSIIDDDKIRTAIDKLEQFRQAILNQLLQLPQKFKPVKKLM